jgi:hypothetical protein
LSLFRISSFQIPYVGFKTLLASTQIKIKSYQYLGQSQTLCHVSHLHEFRAYLVFHRLLKSRRFRSLLISTDHNLSTLVTYHELCNRYTDVQCLRFRTRFCGLFD